MPSPPQPPNQPVVANPLAPARRASILMFVLAGLSLACGGLMALCAVVVTPEFISSTPQSAQMEQLISQSGMSVRMLFGTMAVFMGMPGLLFLIMAMVVRGGGKVSIVLSLILNIVMLLVLVLNIVTALMQGNPAALCVGALPLALGGGALTMLLQAYRNAPHVAWMKQQYQGQYAQYQQQHQMYYSGGQNYPTGGYPPPQQYGQPQYAQPPYPSAPQAGAIPPAPPAAPDPTLPPVRHPPLPPNQQNTSGTYGNPPPQ